MTNSLISRRGALGLGAASAALAAAPVFAAEAPSSPSLAKLARDKGLWFGSAVGAGPPGAITGSFEDPRYRALLAQECGVPVEALTEAVRAVLERFGQEAYSRGVRVVTSLRAADQQAAWAAVRNGTVDPSPATRTPGSVASSRCICRLSV